MNNWDYQFFEESEFSCACCGKTKMDHDFMKKMVSLRRAYAKPIIINSGYRCIEHNEKVGGSRNSSHLEGKAADIKIFGGNALRLVSAAEFCKFTGIGVAQKGEQSGRFIHVDTAIRETDRPRPWLWSY
ncbi:MAG: D-Ala-D-Ala carboxypeptidase family metallohydrolase [Candidatus Thalassarchaeaceae archaeon]